MNGFETILPFLKPIEHLILDDAISEVMVNGPDRIFIERAGFIEPVQDIHLGEKSLMVAVKNIARRLGDDISESKPILDSRLPDGSRVAAVIPPCSVNGVTLTIRKFNARHFGIEDLIQAGTLERWLANQLETYVLARKNILIAGSTGSGKTSLLNVLGKFIPADERVLLIEDTAEIHMAQDNLVRFEARQPQNGLPAISIRDLLKASLRLRPSGVLLIEDITAAGEFGSHPNHRRCSCKKRGEFFYAKSCTSESGRPPCTGSRRSLDIRTLDSPNYVTSTRSRLQGWVIGGGWSSVRSLLAPRCQQWSNPLSTKSN